MYVKKILQLTYLDKLPINFQQSVIYIFIYRFSTYLNRDIIFLFVYQSNAIECDSDIGWCWLVVDIIKDLMHWFDTTLGDCEACKVHFIFSKAKLLWVEYNAFAITQGYVVNGMPECLLHSCVPQEGVINALCLALEVNSDVVKCSGIAITSSMDAGVTSLTKMDEQ